MRAPLGPALLVWSTVGSMGWGCSGSSVQGPPIGPSGSTHDSGPSAGTDAETPAGPDGAPAIDAGTPPGPDGSLGAMDGGLFDAGPAGGPDAAPFDSGPTCALGCPSGYACESGGICAGGQPTDLHLDVRTYNVSGTVTKNGGLPAEACLNAGDQIALVEFDDLSNHDRLTIPAKCAGGNSVRFEGDVFPGTYKVSVIRSDPNASNANLPSGSAFVAVDRLVIQSNLADQALDVRTFSVSGAVTKNGALPADACLNQGDQIAVVQFDDMKKGYHLTIPARCSGGNAVLFGGDVFGGTYKVSVLRADINASNANLPNGAPFVAMPSLSVQSTLSTLALDVRTFTVAGSVTKNGGLPAVACLNEGDQIAQVRFNDGGGGVPLTIAARCSGGTAVLFSGDVFPGTYTVSVLRSDPNASNSNLPTGSAYVVDPSFAVQSNLSDQSFDVRTFSASGSVTKNGALPAEACLNEGDQIALVRFDDQADGYHLSMPARCMGGTSVVFAGDVFMGTYQVSVMRSDPNASNANLPSGSAYVAIPSITIQSSLAGQVLDVETFSVSGSVTKNGALPAVACLNQGDQIALVQFDAQASGYHLTIPARCTAGNTVLFSGDVFPETYKVSVLRADPNASNANLPSGSAFVAVPSLAVRANVSNQALDVRTVTVGGTVTKNGGLPAVACLNSGDQIALVQFDDPDDGYHLSLPAKCTGGTAVAFSGDVFAGIYRISVLRSDPNASNANLPSGAAYAAIDRLRIP